MPRSPRTSDVAGTMLYLKSSLTGDEPADIRQVIKTAIADVELVCARLLEKWDGDASPLRKDLELLLKPISEAVMVAKSDKKVKYKNAEEYVSILSGVEFFRGYVKVKFVITNDLGSALLYFGIFLAMLYVATGRWPFVAVGLGLFALGAWGLYGLLAPLVCYPRRRSPRRARPARTRSAVEGSGTIVLPPNQALVRMLQPGE